MPNLLSILNSASTSLSAQSGAAATASNNLENANTPGYARQTANLSAVMPVDSVFGSKVGGGVTLSSVTQVRDRFVEAQLPVALANGAFSTAQSSALGSVTAFDPQAQGGLADGLSSFYSGLTALSQNPGDGSLRRTAIAAAQTLAQSFNSSAAQVSSARVAIDQQLDGTLSSLNAMAAQMADLNGHIAQARASGAQPNDLLDARQKVQDQLVQLTGATVIQDADGNANLSLAGGTPLVVGHSAATVSSRPDAANGGHLQLLFSSAGSPPAVATPTGGTLGGLLSARDGALATAAGNLDQLATDLAGALNTAHQAGYALDGSTGRALFTLTAGVTGAASSLAVNAAIVGNPSLFAAAGNATAAPGDGGALQAQIRTQSQPLSGGMDASGTAAALTGSFGAAQSAANAYASHDAAVTNHLQALRQSSSGVSIDEEVVNLTKAQRGFEAISKVIQVTNSLFDTLYRMA